MTAVTPDVQLAAADGEVLWSLHGRRREPRPWEQRAGIAVATLVGLLGLGGFVNSFAAVAAAAEPTFGRLAWTVPLIVDLGILALVGLDLILASRGWRLAPVRLAGWALVGVTIYLNVAPQPTWTDRIAHGAVISLWVCAVEVSAHVVRRVARLSDTARRDPIPRTRWLLAPVSTALLWRRMVLWGTTSYPEALRMERDRILARAGLVETYGSVKNAPLRERTLFKLGELAPATVWAEVEAEAEQEAAAEVEAEAERKRNRQRNRKRTTAERVSDLRKRHPELTQAQVAERVGVSVRTVRQYWHR